jgi:hypothetical protein
MTVIACRKARSCCKPSAKRCSYAGMNLLRWFVLGSIASYWDTSDIARSPQPEAVSELQNLGLSNLAACIAQQEPADPNDLGAL